MKRCQQLFLGVLLGCLALPGQGRSAELPESIGWMKAGRDLSAEQAAEIEKHLTTAPDDMEARTKLLGYAMLRRLQDAGIRDRREQNVLWIIGHHPNAAIAGTPFIELDPLSDGEAYDEGRRLWISQVAVTKTNVAVLANAVQFFMVHDKRLAEEYLKRLCVLEPTNPVWFQQLSFLYSLSAEYPRPGQLPAEDFAKALKELETAYRLTTNQSDRVYLMTLLGALALDAGQCDQAQSYGRHLLQMAPKDEWSYALHVHRAHTLLGRVALREDRIAEAKASLLESANITGSTNLNSFPPEMVLAKVLVSIGETNTVMKYLEVCQTVWPKAQAALEKWRQEIRATGTSTFQRGSTTAGLTPEELKKKYSGFLPPKRSAKPVETNVIAMKPNRGYDSYYAMLLHPLNIARRKHDLEWAAVVFEHNIAVRSDCIPCLLVPAVWSALIENDPAASERYLLRIDEVISKIESLTPGRPLLKSYGQFKSALTNAVATFAKIDRTHRVQALYDAYPAIFPLQPEVMQLNRELQTLLDEAATDSPLEKAITTPAVKFERAPITENARQLVAISQLTTNPVIAPDPSPELTARYVRSLHLSPDAKVVLACGSVYGDLKTQKDAFTTAEPIALWIQNNRTDAVRVIFTLASKQGYRKSFPMMLIPGAGSGFDYHPGDLPTGDYVAEVKEGGQIVGRLTIKVITP